MAFAAQQDVENFDPAIAACWVARGRSPDHAAVIAAVWRDFPDLANDAPLADRQERTKFRTQAMKPVFEAIAAQQAAELEAKNFAFTERKTLDGAADDRDLAILRGRDDYGYDWHLSNRYADGWYAAHAGWAHRYSEAFPCRAPLEARRAAYDQGFADGGGDRADLFDAARRSYLAQMRQSNSPPAVREQAPARPLPSAWLKPTDQPRPARWSRRLAIISDADLALGDPEREAWDYLQLIRARPGAEDVKVLILTNQGFVDSASYVPGPSGTRQIDDVTAARQIREAITGLEFDDILVALQGEDLALLDRIAGVLPLCRAMERTRNTRIQFRAHLKVWLDRGVGAADTVAAGHIRWGKVMQGLSGRLGEFTARYVGPAPGGGHLVRVSIAGKAATGFATAAGLMLAPEIVVRSKARLRAELTATLRSFAAATPLMGAARNDG